MKKLLLILLCLPMIGFGQNETFKSFNSKDTYPKLVYQSYTDVEETYYLAKHLDKEVDYDYVWTLKQ